jgi:hypothetical protein
LAGLAAHHLLEVLPLLYPQLVVNQGFLGQVMEAQGVQVQVVFLMPQALVGKQATNLVDLRETAGHLFLVAVEVLR